MQHSIGAKIFLALVQMYQKHVSPHKGFRCAYRVCCGGSGCSGLGKRAVRRYGLLKGLVVTKARLFQCAKVAKEIDATNRIMKHAARMSRFGVLGQRGDCDVGLDCDTPDCECPDLNCPDLSCDGMWPFGDSRVGKAVDVVGDALDFSDLVKNAKTATSQAKVVEAATRREKMSTFVQKTRAGVEKKIEQQKRQSSGWRVQRWEK